MAATPEVPSIDADDVDEQFVPRFRQSVSSVEIEGSPGLLDATTGRALALNESAALIVDYIDGDRTLGRLVDDLARDVGVDSHVLRSDVVGLVKRFGKDGLLEGVRPYVIFTEAPPKPESLPRGTDLRDFALLDLTGRLVSRDDLAGRQTLLINWSPTCGWCDRIAPDLLDLQEDLAAKGVDVVLLSRGPAEVNVRKVAELRLSVRVLLDASGEIDLFAMIGTPAAYVLDEDARVASELAVGGFDVRRLAAELAGRMPGD